MAPPTDTEDVVEEASGSMSRAERRRQKKERRRLRSDPEVAEAEPSSSGAIQPEAEPSSHRVKRKAPLEQSEGERRKRSRKGSPEGEGQKRSRKGSPEGEGQKRSRKGSPEGEGQTRSRKGSPKGEGRKSHSKKAGASASAGARHASDSEASSTVSSPLRAPHMPNPDDFGGQDAPAYHAANDVYDELMGKYHEKKRRQRELVTLDYPMPVSSLVREIQLKSVRESLTEKVLQAAKIILSLSSYLDGKLMTQSSGFLIGWKEETRQGIVLTSAHIICSKYTSLSQWSGADEYTPSAKVAAHLLDETIVPAQLVHYDKQINMALFTVGMESCAKILEFDDLKYGQEIVVMGRDENLNLNVDYEYVGFRGPTQYERPHYMFTSGAIRKSSIGGPVIDLSGKDLKAVGMANFPGSAFIPSSIISTCLDMWKKHLCIPRLHFGIKFSPIKLLDPIHIERILRKCNVDSGLIVAEVSNGSIAEELGVRRGDIITSINGERIATTVELENLNLKICKKHLDQGGTIGSWMDIPVGILHIRKGGKGPSRTLILRLNVTDGMEVFCK